MASKKPEKTNKRDNINLQNSLEKPRNDSDQSESEIIEAGEAIMSSDDDVPRGKVKSKVKGGKLSKKKPKPGHISEDEGASMSMEQEQDVTDWYRDNPVLYDKTHQHYSKRAAKATMQAEKAKELGVTGE